MPEAPLPRVVVVTGTDTDVGKTVVSAAVTATLLASGRSVAAYKPTQTGVGPGDEGDMALVTALTGCRTAEGVRLLAPMAPRPAAALEGRRLPTLEDHGRAVATLLDAHDVVVVEGAGGLLVELTDEGETLADLAAALPDCGVVLVVRSGLGTLNHTMLTREALSRRGSGSSASSSARGRHRRSGPTTSSPPTATTSLHFPRACSAPCPEVHRGSARRPSARPRQRGCRAWLSASAHPDAAGRARCRR